MQDLKGIGILTPVKKIIWVQVLVTTVIALVVLVLSGTPMALSAFAGGAVGFITSLVYAKKMQAPNGVEAKKIVRAHYRAEGYKLVFTILLFSFVFTQFKEVQALPLFATYVATLAVYWAALIFV